MLERPRDSARDSQRPRDSRPAFKDLRAAGDEDTCAASGSPPAFAAHAASSTDAAAFRWTLPEDRSCAGSSAPAGDGIIRYGSLRLAAAIELEADPQAEPDLANPTLEPHLPAIGYTPVVDAEQYLFPA